MLACLIALRLARGYTALQNSHVPTGSPMTASQRPLALAGRHHDRQLFADRYLDETLLRRDAWLALIPDAAAYAGGCQG